MKLYLHQFLSGTGEFSGKKAVFSAVREGEVSVGGRVVLDSKYHFNPEKKAVSWKGRKLNLPEERIYLLLNKPVGYISSRLSERDMKLGKRSVFELIRGDVPAKARNSLFCVGRLDEGTCGLLVLSNDGKLGSWLAKPQSRIGKTYSVVLDKPLTESQISEIEKGVEIVLEENGKTRKYKTKPCSIVRKSDKTFEITISEGKKREVRRIFESIGSKVARLCRISIGGLRLDDLKIREGSYVAVSKEFLAGKIG